jgi:hypothetical protein
MEAVWQMHLLNAEPCMKNYGIETGSRKVLNWDTQNLYKCLAILKIACYKRLEDRYLIKYVSDLWQVGCFLCVCPIVR